MRSVWVMIERAAGAPGGYFGSDWAVTFLLGALYAFDRAATDDPWEQKTQRERREWMAKMDAAVDVLESLATEGPAPAEALPFPVLRDLLRKLGVGVRGVAPNGTAYSEGSNTVDHSQLWDLSRNEWSIPEALRHYREQCHRSWIEQPLSKPRDIKAPRARFIINLSDWLVSNYGAPLQDAIATTAEVMFDDDAINVRLVRRLTTGR
ncbi:hypothetical protein [Cognatilysobacter xinjiangensis]|nr:hypothetical protein [Lysobacter xinjiangensis]